MLLRNNNDNINNGCCKLHKLVISQYVHEFNVHKDTNEGLLYE